MKMKVMTVLVVLTCASGLVVAQEAKKGGAKPQTTTVQMNPLARSGEKGIAKLTAMDADKTRVEITLKGAPKEAQPAKIHEGSCAKHNSQPKYELENVVDGKSVTEVPVGLDALMKGHHVINVQKSAATPKTLVSCGNIAPKKVKAGK